MILIFLGLFYEQISVSYTVAGVLFFKRSTKLLYSIFLLKHLYCVIGRIMSFNFGSRFKWFLVVKNASDFLIQHDAWNADLVVSIPNFFQQMGARSIAFLFRLVFKQVVWYCLGVEFWYLGIVVVFHFFPKPFLFFSFCGLFLVLILRLFT